MSREEVLLADMSASAKAETVKALLFYAVRTPHPRESTVEALDELFPSRPGEPSWGEAVELARSLYQQRFEGDGLELIAREADVRVEEALDVLRAAGVVE